MTDAQLRQMPAADLVVLMEMLREECEAVRREIDRRKSGRANCPCGVVTIRGKLPCECGLECPAA